MLENTRYMQYVSAIVATLAMASLSSYLIWPSPALPMLTSDYSPIGVQLSDEEGSWIVSILGISSLPSLLASGWLLDKFGRKPSLLMSSVSLALPWVIIIFGRSFAAICAAMCLASFGYAVALVGCAMYTAEVADPDIRGKLGTSYIAMMLIGGMIVVLVGSFASYETLAMVCLSIPLVFAALFAFMPESPYYLVKAGKIDEAKRVLALLAPSSAFANHDDGKRAIEDKIEEIERTVEVDRSSSSGFRELFTNVEHRRALVVIAGVKFLMQFSGFVAIEPYGMTIIQATGSSVTPELSAILFGLVQFPSVLVSTIYVDKIGRKPLLIVSSAGSVVTLIAVGVYFYLQDVVGADLSSFSWLPTTSLVAYLFLNTFGVTIVPIVLIGEIFDTNIKGVAMSADAIYTSILGFLLTKFFLPLSKQIGIFCFFWFFAMVCFAGCFFVHFFVPETKGKTFAEIQLEMKGKRAAGKA